MNIAIVGHEETKFTIAGEQAAKVFIKQLLSNNDVLVSGHCHLGGIDIWAEEIADEQRNEKHIFPPKYLQWSPGYKERNIQIAEDCDILWCIAVDKLAPNYNGMKFSHCYHCQRFDHVKGGGCWTMKQAKNMGKETHLHIIENI